MGKVTRHINVKYWREVDQHEFTQLENGKYILAKDVSAMPTTEMNPYLQWNGREADIRWDRGHCYEVVTI